MDALFSGIPGVTCYHDDILVAGKNAQEHYENLARVLAKLETAGFKLNKSNANFNSFRLNNLVMS